MATLWSPPSCPTPCPKAWSPLPKGWLGHQHIAGAPSELTHMRLNPASVNQSFFDVAVEIRHWEGEQA